MVVSMVPWWQRLTVTCEPRMGNGNAVGKHSEPWGKQWASRLLSKALAASELGVRVGIAVRPAPAHPGCPTDSEAFCLGALL